MPPCGPVTSSSSNSNYTKPTLKTYSTPVNPTAQFLANIQAKQQISCNSSVTIEKQEWNGTALSKIGTAWNNYLDWIDAPTQKAAAQMTDQQIEELAKSGISIDCNQYALFYQMNYNALSTQYVSGVSNIGKAIDSIAGDAKESEGLFSQLGKQGVKFTEGNAEWITKSKDGNIIWLEEGDNGSGLQHIMLGHSTEFSKWGLNSQQEVSSFIEDAIKSNDYTIRGAGDYIYNVSVNGISKQMEVVISNNGYIVTAHPYSK